MSGEVELVGSNQAKQPTRWSDVQVATSFHDAQQFPLQPTDSAPLFAVNELTGDGVVTNPSSVPVLICSTTGPLLTGCSLRRNLRIDIAPFSTSSHQQTFGSSVSLSSNNAGRRSWSQRSGRLFLFHTAEG